MCVGMNSWENKKIKNFTVQSTVSSINREVIYLLFIIIYLLFYCVYTYNIILYFIIILYNAYYLYIVY